MTSSLPQTDGERPSSPGPTRSDSGCEVNHSGPFTPSASPPLSRGGHGYQNSPDLSRAGRLYSPTASPLQARHFSGYSSPYSHTPSTGLSRNNSDASQYGGSQYSCSSVSSPGGQYSPAASPSQSRHLYRQSPMLGRHMEHLLGQHPLNLTQSDSESCEDKSQLAAELAQHSALSGQSGISRQQLINSPVPCAETRSPASTTASSAARAARASSSAPCRTKRTTCACAERAASSPSPRARSAPPVALRSASTWA